jgi:hypothetical protein
MLIETPRKCEGLRRESSTRPRPVVRPRRSGRGLVAWGDHDLRGARVGGAGEGVVGLEHVVDREVVGDEPGDVELSAGGETHEGRGGVGVREPVGKMSASIKMSSSELLVGTG